MKVTLFGNEFDIKTRYVVGASVLMAIGIAATAKYVADKMVTKEEDGIFEYKNGKRFIKNKDVAAMMAKKDIELAKARRAAAMANGTYYPGNDTVQVNDVILPGNYYQYR